MEQVPKWDCFRMGIVAELGFREDFVGLELIGSSILGSVESNVMRR